MPPISLTRPPILPADLQDRGLRRRLTNDLRGAIGRGEMAVHYQPRIFLGDGRLAGAEALLRWQHPLHGAIPPSVFIPLAEASDLILRLGGWVLRQATAEAAGWPPESGTISVNVSGRQLETGLISAQVAAALADSGLPPSRLELELTESLSVEDSPETRALLRALRAEGVSLSLDDFGTGYGSLARLRRMPFTALKLDRSFLRDVPGEQEDVAILRSVQDLATALGIRLVAEGVEQEAQHQFLRQIGCIEAQGWLFGRPVPAEVLRRRWEGAIPRIGPLAGSADGPIQPGACPSPVSTLAGLPSSEPASPASPLPAH